MITKSMLTRIACVLIAIVLAVSFSLTVFAAAEKNKTLYVKDVKLIYAKNIETATKLVPEGYTLLPYDLNDGTGNDDVYMVYSTTQNPDEAITDIKMMNMNGGFVYSDYEKELKNVKDTVKELANDVKISAQLFAENYVKGTYGAKAAYRALSVFTVDEAGGHDVAIGTEVPFEVFLFHDDFEGIAFTHIVEEVHLMAEHVSQLHSERRCFPSFRHGFEKRTFHLAGHTDQPRILMVHVHRSREPSPFAAEDEAALIVYVIHDAEYDAFLRIPFNRVEPPYAQTADLEHGRYGLDGGVQLVLIQPGAQVRAHAVPRLDLCPQYLRTAAGILHHIAGILFPRNRIAIAGDTHIRSGSLESIEGIVEASRILLLPHLLHPPHPHAEGGAEHLGRRAVFRQYLFYVVRGWR